MRALFRANTWAFAAATLIVLAIPSLFTLSSFHAYQAAAKDAVRAESLSGEIRYLDEVLTMSARLGANSADPKWRVRYDRHVDALDRAIKDMAALDRYNEFASMLAQTDAANQALIAMETKAFDLAQSGQPKKGYQLVTSPNYAAQKAIYADGLQSATHKVQAGFAAHTQRQWDQLALSALSSLLVTILCFVGWFVFAARALNHQAALHAQIRQERDVAQLASQSKSQFLANMSHELRTPLNAIMGYGEMLLETAQEDQRSSDSKDLGRVLAAAKHLLSLINDLLDLSRIEAGKFEMQIQEIAVQPLLEEVLASIEPAAARRNNRLSTQFEGDLGAMHTDGLRLSQCLLNLLSNAAKFTQNGSITLAAQRQALADGDWLVFSVRDTGCGLSEDQMQRIFEPFVQADGNNTRQHGGAGLGLSITRQLAGLLGGEVSVRSAPGAGACFSLRLPAGGALRLAKAA